MNRPNDPKLATLVAVIAHSPIVVPRPPRLAPSLAPSLAPPLPAGFEAVDLAILEWIAAEGRRAGQRLARV
jgi:hypothetical protein